MSARGVIAAWLFASVVGACTRNLEVLGPALASPRDASPRDASPRDASPHDASPHDASPHDASPRDAGASACSACGPTQLCALDQCQDSSGYTALASSLEHSCAIEDGRMYCWGGNDDGELGLGDQTMRLRRTRVGTFDDWLSVSVGEHHSCGLRAPGRLYCWGANSAGQLALSDTTARAEPTATGDSGVRALFCGGDNCCALDAEFALSCWGDNLEGKLGQNDVHGAPDATRPLPVSAGMRFRDVAVGQGHVCAVRDDGALLCWGRNTDLELGLGSSAPEQLRVPTRVGDAQNWQTIAASQHHSCGTRSSGELFCWGTNNFDELASTSPAQSGDPLRVGSDSDWVAVAAGWFHSCARKRDASLFCWGRAIEGQLGQGGGDNPIATPTPIAMPAQWQQVALGNFASCGLDATRQLYCWGKNDVGDLGLGDTTRRYTPTLVP